MDNKIWYAVMRDSDDTDWGYGSFDLETAKCMAKKSRNNGNPDAYIAVIDDGPDPICIDIIRDMDD